MESILRKEKAGMVEVSYYPWIIRFCIIYGEVVIDFIEPEEIPDDVLLQLRKEASKILFRRKKL